MRAVVCNEFGPLSTLVLEDRPAPDPSEGMVVIDVAAAGVNFVDGLICQGRYQLKPPTPFVPGSEVAGTIAAVGPGVTGWSAGDRVLVFCGFGGFATQVVAPALSLVAVPDAIDLAQAAALIQSYCTILFTLTRRTTVAPGEWVLVLGAGGGIGLAAIDVATALGARVIAAASTPDKLEAAVAMGAEATIDYEEEDLKSRARDLSGGGSTWWSTRWVAGTPSRPCGPPATWEGSVSSVSHQGPSPPFRSTRCSSTTAPWWGWIGAGGRSRTRSATEPSSTS